MLYVAIAAAVVGAVSAVAAGKENSRQMNAQAAASTYNEAVLKQRADTTTQAYGQREEQQRRMAHIAEGKRMAVAAQSGAGLDGSNADVERQSEIFAELDALNIRYEGDLDSRGLLNQSTLEDYSSNRYRGAAGRATQLGYIGAAGSLLSAVGGYGKTSGNNLSGGPT